MRFNFLYALFSWNIEWAFQYMEHNEVMHNMLKKKRPNNYLEILCAIISPQYLLFTIDVSTLYVLLFWISSDALHTGLMYIGNLLYIFFLYWLQASDSCRWQFNWLFIPSKLVVFLKRGIITWFQILFKQLVVNKWRLPWIFSSGIANELFVFARLNVVWRLISFQFCDFYIH